MLDPRVRLVQLLSPLRRAQGIRSAVSPVLPSTHRWAIVGASAALYGLAVTILLVVIPLAIAPRYPLVAQPLAVSLGTVVGLADACLLYLLFRRRDSAKHQRRAMWLTEGVGWTLSAGILAVFARYPDSKALLTLVFPIAVAGVGLEWRGFARTLIVTGSFLISIVMVQWRYLGLMTGTEAQRVITDWGLLLAVTAVASGVIPQLAAQWYRQEMTRRAGLMAAHTASQETNWRHFEAGLSRRERELLPLLAERELTYAEIARRASDNLKSSGKKITASTVKVHVRNISKKLHLDGADRDRLVAVARG